MPKRVAPEDKKKNSTVKHVNDRHYMIARLSVLGYSNKEIEARTGITNSHISKVKHSPIVANHIKDLQLKEDIEVCNIQKRIKEIAEDAVDIFDAILNGGNLSADIEERKLQFNVAKSTLNKAGFSDVKEVEKNTNYINADQINIIKEKAAKAKDNNVIDI